jgi:hypothetical protein
MMAQSAAPRNAPGTRFLWGAMPVILKGKPQMNADWEVVHSRSSAFICGSFPLDSVV